MEFLNWLERRRQEGKLRRLSPFHKNAQGLLIPPYPGNTGQVFHDFSSNDYLALSRHPEVISRARQYLEQEGAGAGAARLMSGDRPGHHELEEEVAALKDQEAALLFGSGYLAASGIIPALAGRHDVIFADRLNHASLYDGCRLASSRLVRCRHNDMEHLEEQLKAKRGRRRALIIVESVYSMDGDCAPLRDLVFLKEKYDCLLLVDEAHATGIFGEKGGSLLEAQGVADRVDLALGTLGKALGSYGAYVACSGAMKEYLVNRAKSFIYSTALPPPIIGACLAAVRLVREQPELRRELDRRVDLFKEELLARGINFSSPTQIVPLQVGGSRETITLAERFRQESILVTAVRPPTVPEGTARLRFSVTLYHSDELLRRTAELVGRFVD
ncbi:MAG: aminotransferase class I/II-fold pyridoxal phosphate-dependent enzyme [Desulfurivibrionaceae bacterium]